MPLFQDEELERRIWEKCQHVWTIKKFSSLKHKGTGHRLSTSFSASASSFCQWRLELYPSAKNEKHEDCISLKLILEESLYLSDVFAKFSLSLRDFRENVIESSKFENEFSKGDNFVFPMIKKSLFTSKIITDNILEILIEISCIADRLESYHKIDSDSGFSDAQLTQAFGSMFDNERFSDIVVLIDDEEIKVHRCVLSARSTVFSAMFEHKDLENVTRKIRITDFCVQAVRLMLRFMYTGQVDIPDVSTGMELLRAADKYDLNGLKMLSADYLAWNINVTTVEEILLAAEAFRCELLKKLAIGYIIENLKKFSKRDQFHKIEDENPCLLTELFLETASKLSDEIENKQPS